MARSPYPGLRPFERDEADIFFGREKQVDAMVNRLARQRLLAVTGSSGCGKSSLVRAGLLEALEMGLLAEAGPQWRFMTMRPREHPMSELAGALLHALGRTLAPEEVALRRAALDRGPLSLVEEFRERPFDGGNLLILVDQFEELFRYRGLAGREEAEAFVALMLASAAQRDVPLYVVLTMRSDFFGECAQLEGLAEAMCDALYLCPRLSREQIVAAIEGPARVFGGGVEPALVARLANDMGTDSDQLPLMQHALMRLWDQHGTGEAGAPVLRLDDYIAAEGIKGSLSRHADEILEQLALDAPQRRRTARRLFCLVTDGAGSQAVRRLATVGEVMDVADQPLDEVACIANAYRAPGACLLMPPADQALTPDTVLDISHESLIRNWNALGDWVRAETVEAAQYRDFERSAQQRLHGEAGPWDPGELHAASNWIERSQPNLAWAARYGGDLETFRNFVTDAAARQKRAIHAVRAALIAMTIETVTLAVFAEAAFVIWVGIIAGTFWSVHHTLGRNFAAARQFAILWAGFYVLMSVAVGYAIWEKHQMLVYEVVALIALAFAVPALVYSSWQLRPLTRQRIAAADASGVIDPRRHLQARYAVYAGLAILAAISFGQFVYAFRQPAIAAPIGDAIFTLVIAGAVYATLLRNLRRNLLVARGAAIAWIAIGVCFVLYNVSVNAIVFALADATAVLCIAFALYRLWDAAPGSAATPS
jgi:hypothetical protein